MKIGFFTEGYLPQITGVATTVDTCARALEKLGHEVYIIAPRYPDYKDRKNVIRIPSFRYPKNSQIRLATFFPGKSLLLASKVDFDIIHGHAGGMTTLLGWEVAKLKRVPFVVTYHTLWNQYTHYVFKGKIVKPKMAEIASKLFGNLCDTLIVPTKKVQEELLSYGVDKPIEVIANGLELDHFTTGKRNVFRKNYRIHPQTSVLLYVGRLAKEKSIDYLLRSFRVFIKKRPDSLFVIVGEGPEKVRLQELAKKLSVDKNALFTGAKTQQELPDIYKGSDVFIFASKSETQGMVILEAMASEVPVVTIADDAYSEIIKNNESGILVKGAPRDFAKAIESLLQDEKKMEKMVKAAKKRVQEYSIAESALKLEALYKELIAKNSKKIDFPFKQLSKYLLVHN